MEIGVIIQFVIAIVGVLLAVPLSTAFHELGHALPALLWTQNKPVKMYLGSYGVEDSAWRIAVGRLNIFVHKAVLRSIRGLVDYDHVQVSTKKFVFLVLNGPLFSMLVAGTALSLGIVFKLGFGFLIAFGTWALTAVVQSVKDLVPNRRPIHRENGEPTYNDGELIRTSLRFLKQPEGMQAALKLYWDQQYGEALTNFDRLWKEGERSQMLFQCLLDCCRQLENFSQGAKWANRYHEVHDLSAEELAQTGYFYLENKDYQKGMRDLNNALAENPDLPSALMNRGVLHLRNEEVSAALSDLDRALALEDGSAAIWASRGHCLTLLDRLEEAKVSLLRGEKLASQDPFVKAYLGYYYLQTGKREDGITYLKEIDPESELVEWAKPLLEAAEHQSE